VIRENRASFTIRSERLSAAEISAALQLEPSEAADIGDPIVVRPGDPRPRPNRHPETTFWCLDAPHDEGDTDDPTGTAALRALVDVLLPRKTALTALGADCTSTIWWSGDSDSTQGGFVLAWELMRDLGALGCDVYGTAFLTEDEDTGDRTT
jgi:hypothetical protein